MTSSGVDDVGKYCLSVLGFVPSSQANSVTGSSLFISTLPYKMNQPDFHVFRVPLPGNQPGVLAPFNNPGILPESHQGILSTVCDSFQIPGFGVYLPGTIYWISPEPTGREVVAVIFIAATEIPDDYYIYNVCTAEPYRRLSLMSRLFAMLSAAKYHLEVSPTNEAAYRLYTSIGFQFDRVTTDGYHLLRIV